jgi:hypothetical protein
MKFWLTIVLSIILTSAGLTWLYMQRSTSAPAPRSGAPQPAP